MEGLEKSLYEKNFSHNVQIIECKTEEELQEIHVKKSIDPQYKCNICSKRYSSNSALKTHKIRHKDKDDLPFHCMFCPYKSATKRDLLRHHDQHIGHARQVYKCDSCTKSFNISASLSEHIRSVHTRDTLYKCGMCSFSCWRRSTLRLHLRMHRSKIRIICPVCDSTFQTKSNLKSHLMTHANAKPFACDKCDMRFIVKNRLISHQRSVHLPKTFECDTCQKCFPSIHRLKRHELIHTGERPFKCCFCSFDSNTQGNLLTHVRNIHNEFHFTYKDILIMNGHFNNPMKDLTSDEIKKLLEEGREASELHLKKLRDRGLTSTSLEQLEKEMNQRREAKAALVHTNRKKNQKVKKTKKAVTHRKEMEKESEDKKRPNVKKHTKNKYDFSNCNEFVMPPIESVTHSPDIVNAVEVSTTPTIQVIWNISYPDNTKKKSSKKPNLKRQLKLRPKSGTKKTKKSKTISFCNAVGSEHVELSRSININSPSTILEDDLAFSDKPLLHHLHETANFQANSNNVLHTSLDNLHTDLVSFDKIEPPNAVVVTTDGISDMYKNLELCNQFLHINEDDSHFINSFDSGNLQKESKITYPKSHIHMSSIEENNKDENKEKLIVSAAVDQIITIPSPPIKEICNKPIKKNDNNISYFIHNDEKGQKIENSSMYYPKNLNDIRYVCKLSKRQKIDNYNVEDSDLMLEMQCLDTVSDDRMELKIDSEEIILIQSGDDELSSISPCSPISSSDLTKEIIIKNAHFNHKLNNDEMEVMAIAEIEENENELVLVIDSLS